MNFTLPTTKQAMYDTLQDIFYYYRIRRESFQELELEPLTLPRITYIELTTAQLETKARDILSSQQQKEILKATQEIEEKIAYYQSVSSAAEQTYLTVSQNIIERFNQSQEKIQTEATKKGLANSSIILDKLAQLEVEKNSQLTVAETEKNLKINECEVQLLALNNKKAQINATYAQMFEKEVIVKRNELQEEQQKIAREIFKYNNSLEEKEQRYQNTILQANAELRLKYNQMNGQFFSKDQLVEMGYYADVVDCVCGYYNTLDALTAYNDILSESKLAVYLEDYYDSIVYLYRSKAGL